MRLVEHGAWVLVSRTRQRFVRGQRGKKRNRFNKTLCGQLTVAANLEMIVEANPDIGVSRIGVPRTLGNDLPQGVLLDEGECAGILRYGAASLPF